MSDDPEERWRLANEQMGIAHTEEIQVTKSGDGVVDYVSVDAKTNGDVVLSGQMLGKGLEGFFGKDEHEYWVTVRQEHVGHLIAQLVKAVIGGRMDASNAYKEWLDAMDIPYEFSTY